jgi:hypothetical protein
MTAHALRVGAHVTLADSGKRADINNAAAAVGGQRQEFRCPTLENEWVLEIAAALQQRFAV